MSNFRLLHFTKSIMLQKCRVCVQLPKNSNTNKHPKPATATCLLRCYWWRVSCGFPKSFRMREEDIYVAGTVCSYSPWQSYRGTAPCVHPARPPTILLHLAVCSRWCHPPSGSTHRPAEPHNQTPPRLPLCAEGKRESWRSNHTAETPHCSIICLCSSHFDDYQGFLY